MAILRQRFDLFVARRHEQIAQRLVTIERRAKSTRLEAEARFDEEVRAAQCGDREWEQVTLMGPDGYIKRWTRDEGRIRTDSR